MLVEVMIIAVMIVDKRGRGLRQRICMIQSVYLKKYVELQEVCASALGVTSIIRKGLLGG